MSEENFVVSTEGLGTFTPYDGDGPAAWLSKDGDFPVRIKKATPGRVEATGNLKLDLVLEVIDDSEDRGKILYRTVTCSGEVLAGQNKGEKNIKQLGKVLYSAGRTVEQVRALETSKSVDLRNVAKALTDPQDNRNIAYVHGVTSKQTMGRNAGQYRTEVSYFTDKKSYDENKASGNHRKERDIKGADERYEREMNNNKKSAAGQGDQAVSTAGGAANGATMMEHAEASKAAAGI